MSRLACETTTESAAGKVAKALSPNRYLPILKLGPWLRKQKFGFVNPTLRFSGRSGHPTTVPTTPQRPFASLPKHRGNTMAMKTKLSQFLICPCMSAQYYLTTMACPVWRTLPCSERSAWQRDLPQNQICSTRLRLCNEGVNETSLESTASSQLRSIFAFLRCSVSRCSIYRYSQRFTWPGLSVRLDNCKHVY